MNSCRACQDPRLARVLDLGRVPAADHFPCADAPVGADEARHALAMDLCLRCGLAQLADDDTVPDEPRGVEPQALRDQAEAAVGLAQESGWLRGRTVIEFGSPHGGTWLPLLAQRGFTALSGPSRGAADVVLDSFGIMHEPDQQAAFLERAASMAADGVLLLQYQSITAILGQRQWNALRHGHFAYYSLTALTPLLASVGLHVHTAWDFDLYGGTQLIAASRGSRRPDATVRRTLAAESALGVTEPSAFSPLQASADEQVTTLRTWLQEESRSGRTVLAYGAASRAVSLFSRAGLDSTLLAAVADAAPAKQGRRMPGTDIPIISPAELVARAPDHVYLTVPDMLAEVDAQHPQLTGRWHSDIGDLRITAGGQP
ncbi:transferase [Mycobacterium sp. ACS4331]|uniref:transferase n=1 Tax=Mycobacterium sp. ACS4331 TaxID=1834121 RepID=UPI0008004D4A|nr:transferase [Mycobacterium sp. ACS4331]OBF27890.1 transferase [Mycobacterium sp. ACS4331]